MNDNETTRPWGQYEILSSGATYKVKKIIVNPLGRISYQSHDFRNEMWVIVSGTGLITIDEIQNSVSYGSVICIPKKSKHRIENTSVKEQLIFIEVQTGSSFEEGDIIRYSDDYGRS